jgi:hypothetical protein
MHNYNQMMVTAQPSMEARILTRLIGSLSKLPQFAGTCNYATVLTQKTSLSLLLLILIMQKSS